MASRFADAGVCALSCERLADEAMIISGANAVRKAVGRSRSMGG
jgi:hypothetical protein